jgi:hypothetical protein
MPCSTHQSIRRFWNEARSMQRVQVEEKQIAKKKKSNALLNSL